MSKKKLNIAINELGGAGWTGGITYRQNLLKALKAHAPEVNIVFISNEKEDKIGFDTKGYKIINPKSSSTKFSKIIDKVSRRFFNYDRALAKTLKDENIDVLFPGHHSIGSKTATIYWIPDFQFMHLPEFTSKEVVNSFNKKLPKYFKAVPNIIVSSNDALQDLKKFAPEYIHKARVMSFVAHVPEKLYDQDIDEVLKLYNLPEEFIYSPNQFWAHKNHTVILEALKILKKKGVKPVIVFTGNPLDKRNPLYFAKLLKKLNEFGLRDQIVFLGFVPHEHVYALIRLSKFVLNASLFEGWSTIVEESKSVGKKLLLSNLNVHIEQNAPGAKYFDPHDPEDLAKEMEIVWNSTSAGSDFSMEKEAKEKLPERMKDFAQTFISICNEALAKRRSN